MIRMLAASSLIAFIATTASAQNAPAPAPAPADMIPATPAASTPSPAANPGYFPQLPPSRPCEERDIKGAWKLRAVYENPVGQELGSFTAQPFQYLLFGSNSLYWESKSAYDSTSELFAAYRSLRQNESGANLNQYVLDKSGMIFFYRDGVAWGTMACFIVATPFEGFEPGQMLMMPPENQAVTRVVKVYDNEVKGLKEIAPRPENNKGKGEVKQNKQQQKQQAKQSKQNANAKQSKKAAANAAKQRQIQKRMQQLQNQQQF